MGLLYTAKNQIISGEYDFAKDSTGGVMGNIDLLVPIPSCAMIKNFWVNPLVAVAGTVNTTVSFDLNFFTSVGTFISAGLLLPVTNIAALGVVGTPIQGFTTNANPFKLGQFTNTASGVNISMTIGFAGIGIGLITAGRLQFWAEYTENNI